MARSTLVLFALVPAMAGASPPQPAARSSQAKHDVTQQESSRLVARKPPAAALRKPLQQELLKAEQERAKRDAAALEAAGALRAAEANARILAEKRVQAASALRKIENEVIDENERLRSATAEQLQADAVLAHTTDDFERLLPLVLRLSRFPAETVLAVIPQVLSSRRSQSLAPADGTALEGLLIARGLAAELNQEAATLRQAKAAALSARQQVDKRARLLAMQRARQQIAGSALDLQLHAAKAQALDARETTREAAEVAAGIAGQARTLRDALAALDDAEAAARTKEAIQARKPQKSVLPSKENSANVPPASTSDRLVAPVAGHIVRAWGEAAEDGPASGITYATASGAFVASPCSGHVAFAAPFRSYGQLLIIECRAGYDVVLAGLSRLDAAVGHPIKAGEPVGRMAGGAQPSLYVELRRNGQPVNPAPFLITKG